MTSASKNVTKKNLAILFCSFRPAQYPINAQNGRESEYNFCIRHFLDVIPLDLFDVVVADNTVAELQQLKSKELQEFLRTDSRIEDVYLFADNLGEKGNKGLGELQMLAGVLENVPHGKYEKVSYVTARRLVSNPYIFEKTSALTKEALVSNPDFCYLNGKVVESEKKGMYNDMFFSMTEKRMREYSAFSVDNMEFNAANHIGSEQNLFRFITKNNVECEFVKWLGLIRNDWMIDFNQSNIANVHVC